MKNIKKPWSKGRRLHGKPGKNPEQPAYAPRPPIPTPPDPPKPGEEEPRPVTKPQKNHHKALRKGHAMKLRAGLKLFAIGAKGKSAIHGMRSGRGWRK